MSTLAPGSRLGPYEISELCGKGGMGEVYRAHDSRLDRDVAIKVLAESLSEDGEFSRRFEREAKTISQLQHPHVCTLFDIGSDQGRDYLVMELLAGETLEARLKRGALALEDVLVIGAQIAEAIEAAHRQNLVHRDLKPGNVMLTPTGAKVLDFGLAKGMDGGPVIADTQTPTATQALTSDGSILGTLHYMAPEQLEGKNADVRSDIFALGAVLYEMASGARPFQGESQALLIASIMTAKPEPLSARRPSLPARLGKVIDRCLRKDPERRWQSARDIALELEEIADETETVAETSGREPATRPRRTLGVVALSALALGLLAGALSQRTFSSKSSDLLNGGSRSQTWTVSSLDLGHDPRYVRLSPDGRRLASTDIEGNLYLRELDSTLTVPVPDLVLTLALDFSPDGESLSFGIRESGVHELAIESGVVSELLPGARHGFRNWDGFLYWITLDDPTSLKSVRLWRRPMDWGGNGEMSGQAQDLGPGFTLAGGTMQGGNVVFVSQIAGTGPVTIERFDVEGGDRESIGEGTQPSFLPPGFLVFFRDNNLWAAPADPNDGRLLDSPRVVETGIADTPEGQDSGIFSLSRTGDLVYRTETGRGQVRAVWTSRTGDDLGAAAPESGPFVFPEISPNGRFALMLMSEAAGTSAHRRLDLVSGAWSLPTQTGRRVGTPRWVGRDGEEWLFSSDEGAGGVRNIFIGPANGSHPAVRMVSSETDQVPLDVSPDGRLVLYHGFSETGFWSFDRNSGESTRITASGYVDSAAFHPSGEWIAYADLARGDGGIWVRPTRQSGQALRLTEGRDAEIRWSPRGDELYYRSDTHVMSIPVEINGGRLDTGRPVELFEDRFARSPFRGITNWAVHPDGRFLFFESADAAESGKVVYVQNWVAKVESVFARLQDD